MESIKKRYRIDRREIHFIKFILEAYEGVAVLTTLDPKAGLIELMIAPGREDEALDLIEDLGAQMRIERVESN
ncbi:MAG: DUF4911 domain-containing protein [Deltaproteobacteria bacterium]|nr:DUF4911 domain-containing protein [Deltaproteobacteria bacterium]